MRYLDKSIEELHELLKSKTIKPIDLVEEAFERSRQSAGLMNHRIVIVYDSFIIKPFLPN